MKVNVKDNPTTFEMIKTGECFSFIYENGTSGPFMKMIVDNRATSVNLSNGHGCNVEFDTEVNPLNLMVTNA